MCSAPMCPMAELVTASDCYLLEQSEGREFEPHWGRYFAPLFVWCISKSPKQSLAHPLRQRAPHSLAIGRSKRIRMERVTAPLQGAESPRGPIAIATFEACLCTRIWLSCANGLTGKVSSEAAEDRSSAHGLAMGQRRGVSSESVIY